eukprot:CAMPEP_0172079510 /NCGR_PEP_ID=MMETSP1043-20130122/18213_1 /TAXON_ID=464988 /ORGANISM="Hemiselmis andersenii, Strain CCMP441" /LENGTH=63 /DNA_ID=CAMNT_0012740701 /DNA_START=1 /DNA_END=189 /DNA_ORIENTATION=-
MPDTMSAYLSSICPVSSFLPLLYASWLLSVPTVLPFLSDSALVNASSSTLVLVGLLLLALTLA